MVFFSLFLDIWYTSFIWIVNQALMFLERSSFCPLKSRYLTSFPELQRSENYAEHTRGKVGWKIVKNALEKKSLNNYITACLFIHYVSGKHALEIYTRWNKEHVMSVFHVLNESVETKIGGTWCRLLLHHDSLFPRNLHVTLWRLWLNVSSAA